MCPLPWSDGQILYHENSGTTARESPKKAGAVMMPVASQRSKISKNLSIESPA
jgi:hypothetical protein